MREPMEPVPISVNFSFTRLQLLGEAAQRSAVFCGTRLPIDGSLEVPRRMLRGFLRQPCVY